MGISTVFMAQMNGGFNTTAAKSIGDPLTTVTNTGSQQQLVTATLITNTTGHAATDLRNAGPTVTTGQHHALVTAFMERQFGASVGQGVDEPAPTITAGGGGKSSLVELQLSPEVEAGALRVAAFLISYYGTENVSAAGEPAPTITTKDRLGLVTVTIKGTPYVIVDICLRMLQPPELKAAQGFDKDYIIDRGLFVDPVTGAEEWRDINKTDQVRLIGNSVCPDEAEALVSANAADIIELYQRLAA
jgi:DNA (cytosine-5)-methyltransferase 1